MKSNSIKCYSISEWDFQLNLKWYQKLHGRAQLMAKSELLAIVCLSVQWNSLIYQLFNRTFNFHFILVWQWSASCWIKNENIHIIYLSHGTRKIWNSNEKASPKKLNKKRSSLEIMYYQEMKMLLRSFLWSMKWFLILSISCFPGAFIAFMSSFWG